MNYKHGHFSGNTVSPTYNSWIAMKRRCTDPNNASYEHYGALDITYDPRWEDFNVFLADMGERPLGKTLDRKDNTRGYCKDNCRWATKTEQSRNSAQAKLTLELAREIRAVYWREKVSQRALAKRYGVSLGVINTIILNRAWRDE